MLLKANGIESCSAILVRDKRSVEFVVRRSFMKLSQTGSAAVVRIFFHFLPITYQTVIGTAKFSDVALPIGEMNEDD